MSEEARQQLVHSLLEIQSKAEKDFAAELRLIREDVQKHGTSV